MSPIVATHPKNIKCMKAAILVEALPLTATQRVLENDFIYSKVTVRMEKLVRRTDKSEDKDGRS